MANELCGKVRAAIDKYKMIQSEDVLAVGVSGGKDSLLLLWALSEIRNYYPEKFSLTAVSLDPCFFGINEDYSCIERFCKERNIEYKIKRTNLAQVIFEERKEKNPCSMCARMRRGILHNMAKELGANKLCLGHNFDDAAQTFIMNLLYGGNVSCFSPVTYLSRKDITVIRPLIFCEEKEIEKEAKRLNLPVIKSRCPEDENTKRKEADDLLSFLEKTNPHIRNNIMGAMQRGNISGWGI